VLLLCGTVPNKDLACTFGPITRDGDYLMADGQRFSGTQGTGAMISAALAITTYFHLEPPHVLIAGDIGDGRGTRAMYDYLYTHLETISPEVLTMHYSQPIMALMRKFIEKMKSLPKKPFLIADAGAMYAAKGAGLAQEFDIFTPDPSEIAFLADPKATHPAYIAHHLLDCDVSKIPQQVIEAFILKSAAKLLIVKGKRDYIARGGEILETVNDPDVPALEPIGGTGDTITGLVSALVYAGMEPKEAAVFACRTNRMAGKLVNPTPATKVKEIIDMFPRVCKEYYCSWSGICYTENS
jgi:NAD(P)H-hydrate repair Nnr-like enzyme with NAD(P)H-hydrate dehydratase domain